MDRAAVESIAMTAADAGILVVDEAYASLIEEAKEVLARG
jgi:histidinol-phosphate/aromatic aminotransferase/cobyric acid decarboxylase-like protein